jgi:hypothetical protein
MLLRHGAGSPLILLILPALFEEANRMRRFTVSAMRGLAERGIGTVLPDLPGTGESLVPLADVSFEDWQDATASVIDLVRAECGQCLTVAIRGGALLDGPADHGWRLAPETGERILRDLIRATAVSANVSATEIDRRARAEATALAGQVLSVEMYTELSAAALSKANRHTVRLTEDIGLRDGSLSGTRLWRTAEPGEDPAFVAATVAAISDWSARCVAR